MARRYAARRPCGFAQDQGINLLAGNKGSTSALYPCFLRSGLVDVSPLDVQYVGSAPGQMQLQLLSGALHVSGYGAMGVAEANLKGADFKLFLPFDHNHSSWIVRSDSPYKSLHDLKGKKVATLPINTDTVRQAELTAALHGLDLKRDFQLSYGPALVSLALFERGDVDTVIAIEPNSTRLVAKGAREIAKVRDLWTDATGDSSFFPVGWAASEAWLKANEAAGKTIARAYYYINREIVRNPGVIAQPVYLDALGVPAAESRAVELLSKRIADITSIEWNDAVPQHREAARPGGQARPAAGQAGQADLRHELRMSQGRGRGFPRPAVGRRPSALGPRPSALGSLVLVLWQTMASWLANPLVPSLAEIGHELQKSIAGGTLLQNMAATLHRVAIGFVLAFVTAFALALGMSRRQGLPVVDCPRWMTSPSTCLWC